MLRARKIALLAVSCLLLVACEAGKPADPVPLPPVGPAPVPATSVLDPVHGVAGPVDRAAAEVLNDPALGPAVGAVVVDTVTRSVVLDRDSTVPRAPASLLKLVTAAAALTTIDPRSRLRTAVVESPDGVVLVGSGDTTLRNADLRRLADGTVEALRSHGRTSVQLAVDTSLYEGPAVSPHWRPTYVPAVVEPVRALSAATAKRFARLLTRRGVEVTGVSEGAAPVGAVELAAVESPTVAELVEVMLRESDNDLAESLLRQVALAAGRPATFADGTAAALTALQDLGVGTDAIVMLDGSGLARGSRIAPRTLADLLVLAADPETDPALDHLLSGLPVAGFSGTLATRFDRGLAPPAAGLVRAKTGTLTGISTLAGVGSDATSAVVFVAMAGRVPGDTLAARSALDRFAALASGALPRLVEKSDG